MMILIATVGDVKMIGRFFLGETDSGVYASCMANLAPRLDGHFARCAAIAATIGCETVQAMAAIHHSGIVNINIPSNVQGVYLNVVTGVFGSNPAAVPGWTINPWG